MNESANVAVYLAKYENEKVGYKCVKVRTPTRQKSFV